MRKFLFITMALMLLGFSVTSAGAATAELYEWAFNINGTVHYMSMPAVVSGTFNSSTGLGSLSWTTSGAGTYKFIGYFDHEIDQAINTFFNESGAANGVPGSKQSWQLDDPWNGNIYGNVIAGSLNNTNTVGTAPQDVSMALGWDFTLASYQTALITLSLSETAPRGFFLSQTDPNSQYTIYYSGELDIRGVPPQVPLPAAVWFLGSGLVGLIGLRWRKRA